MSNPREQVTAPKVSLRFHLPSADLAPFVTTYYLMEVDAGPEGVVEDWLHPEWANLRITVSGGVEAAPGLEEPAAMPRIIGAGPTSLATRFRIRQARVWGIGMLPMGWLKFVDGAAADYADGTADAGQDPAWHVFAGLSGELAQHGLSVDEEIACLERALKARLDHPVPEAETVSAVHKALVEGEASSVAGLADAAGLTPRTLERLSKRVFGFPPKLLLRRQRFLRSLAQFMLDPSLSWLDTMDSQYHDQAHFIRDFRRFMGMTPSEYGARPHPILFAAAIGRSAIAGEAVQALHKPEAPPD